MLGEKNWYFLTNSFSLLHIIFAKTLLWRHNGLESVSNHQPHECLLNRSFGRRSRKTSKLRVTGLCAGTGEFPAQMASDAQRDQSCMSKVWIFCQVVAKFLCIQILKMYDDIREYIADLDSHFSIKHGICFSDGIVTNLLWADELIFYGIHTKAYRNSFMGWKNISMMIIWFLTTWKRKYLYLAIPGDPK